MSMISTIYCLRLHYTLGQNEIPRYLRATFPFAHKYLWLAQPPSRPLTDEPSADNRNTDSTIPGAKNGWKSFSGSKVAPIEAGIIEKKVYAELLEKVSTKTMKEKCEFKKFTKFSARYRTIRIDERIEKDSRRIKIHVRQNKR